MKYDEKSGNYLNNYDNIVEMFEFLNENYELLKEHQLVFIKSLQSSFNERKTLSKEQFKWLAIYFDKICLDLDIAEDYDYGYEHDWDDGHPSNFGDR